MSEFSYNQVLQGKHELTESQIQAIKDFLLKGTRSGSRTQKAFKRFSIFSVKCIPQCGILNRLMIDGDRVHYVAGQSYPDEIRTVREIFVKALE